MLTPEKIAYLENIGKQFKQEMETATREINSRYPGLVLSNGTVRHSIWVLFGQPGADQPGFSPSKDVVMEELYDKLTKDLVP